MTLPLSALTQGCGQDATEDLVYEAQAPRYLASADSTEGGDVADSRCRVVLRSVARVSYQSGYMTTCETDSTTTGSCHYIWRGFVDVAADQDFQRVAVLFRAGDRWFSFPATPSGPAVGGYVPHTFEIDQYTPSAGTSLTSLMGTVLNLIPYAETTSGGRIFDHNRIADPFGNYQLDKDNSWSVGADTSVCVHQAPVKTPEYRLDYPAGEHLIDGPVRTGGQLKINYDSRRLRETQSCMGSHGSASSTTIRMGYIVDGDGSSAQDILLETYIESQGNTRGSKDVQSIDVPASAKSIEMWFYCVPGFSSGAEYNWKYDSNYGANYHLTVPRPKAVTWAGSWGLHAGRSGFTRELPEPYVYDGFTNMGFSIQAEVYVAGITDQPQLDTQKLKAYVETDVLGCQPGGGHLKRQELELAQAHAGGYGNNVLYRWPVEASLMRCPTGTYHYRFLFSADGGLTFTPLGNAESTAAPGAGAVRTIENNRE